MESTYPRNGLLTRLQISFAARTNGNVSRKRGFPAESRDISLYQVDRSVRLIRIEEEEEEEEEKETWMNRKCKCKIFFAWNDSRVTRG